MYLLESETAGEFERGLKDHARNASGPVETGQNQSDQPFATGDADTFLLL